MGHYAGANRVFRALSVAAVAAAISIGGCSGGEEERAAPAKQSKIERVDGMRYYVGGPQFTTDPYGRNRLSGFSGQVTAPPSRGLVIGFKPIGEKNFEYHTYLNGRIVQRSTGFTDDGGRLWFEERATYDSEGRVITRQSLKYDKEREVSISKLEYVDAESGETVKVIDAEVSLRPVVDAEQEAFLSDPQPGSGEGVSDQTAPNQ
jgi:hypothetical protein